MSFSWLIPTVIVKRAYIKWGAMFGDMLSYLYIGKAVGFEKAFSKWKKWEVEYARRGYRTIPIDDFIKYGGGYVKTLSGLDELCENGEETTLHTEIYAERFLGREQSLVRQIDTHRGTYSLPSTK